VQWAAAISGADRGEAASDALKTASDGDTITIDEGDYYGCLRMTSTD
jgi:hypothetical protein